MNSNSGNSNKTIWIVVIVAIIAFLLFKNPMEFFNGQGLDAGSGLASKKKVGLSNKFSYDCCGAGQWPVDHDIKRDGRVASQIQNGTLLSTNMMGDGLTGAGCLCARPGQYKYLACRGGNGCKPNKPSCLN